MVLLDDQIESSSQAAYLVVSSSVGPWLPAGLAVDSETPPARILGSPVASPRRHPLEDPAAALWMASPGEQPRHFCSVAPSPGLSGCGRTLAVVLFPPPLRSEIDLAPRQHLLVEALGELAMNGACRNSLFDWCDICPPSFSHSPSPVFVLWA